MSIGTYGEPDAVSKAINYAKFCSRSHDAVIRVYDETGNVIETHEQAASSESLIFPEAAKQKRTSTLSHQFRGVLVEAGLLEPRDYKRVARRGRARDASEISFHSLRHSAVTMLKASGLSDVFAREIVGHDSAAVSRQYSHLSTEHKRNAMRNLPDVTA